MKALIDVTIVRGFHQWRWNIEVDEEGLMASNPYTTAVLEHGYLSAVAIPMGKWVYSDLFPLWRKEHGRD
jgi:hypothetical protein